MEVCTVTVEKLAEFTRLNDRNQIRLERLDFEKYTV